MRAILDEYCVVSGQLANIDKSYVYFTSNTSKEVRSNIVDSLCIVSSDYPSKYLGHPVIRGRSKDEALAFVRDMAVKKIQG